MVARQHEMGKLTARERLAVLFDNGTFQEVNLFVKREATLSVLDKKETPVMGL